MSGALFCVSLLAVVLGRQLRFSRSIDRRTIASNQSSLHPTKQTEPQTGGSERPSKNLAKLTKTEATQGSILLLFVIVFFWIAYVHWAEATPARCWWWTLMNTPFGSLLFSTAIASFVGWWFYRFWDDSQNRRDQEWEEKLDSYRQEIADQRRSDRDIAMADILEKFDLDQAQLNTTAKRLLSTAETRCKR